MCGRRPGGTLPALWHRVLWDRSAARERRAGSWTTPSDGDRPPTEHSFRRHVQAFSDIGLPQVEFFAPAPKHHMQRLLTGKAWVIVHGLDRKSTRLNSSHLGISYA